MIRTAPFLPGNYFWTYKKPQKKTMKWTCFKNEIIKKRCITSHAAIYLLFVSLFVMSVGIQTCFAQAGKGVLEIPAKGVFQMPEDTLVLGELIMHDSSKIILSKSAKSYIKVRRMSVGQGCLIIGDGLAGATGKSGRAAANPVGLCKNGLEGEPGKPAPDGEQGKDFILDVVQLEVKAMLGISLIGGTGGDGGNGGKGSHGSKSTIHCACNGGNGGNGGSGGNGRKGGVLTLRAESPASSELMTSINLNNRGGYRGLGGEGGKGGLRGAGSSERDSKFGVIGKPGADGIDGQEGKPLFYSIVSNSVTTGSSAQK
jgi:hypothetical protein